MTDWQAVIADDLNLPEGLDLPQAVAELSEMLRSPDPVVRDELGFTALARLTARLDPHARLRLGDEMAARLHDPELQARTFAPLVLARLVASGSFRAHWLTDFEAWYPAERELLGYDPARGWLHAAAHGADLLGAFGLCEQVDPERMLHLGAVRLLTPTDYVLRDQEDDRIANALARTLTREQLTESASTSWLDLIAADFENGEPGPVPAQASNTMRTLRMLYLLADLGVRLPDGSAAQLRHRDAVKHRLAKVLAVVNPVACS